MNSEPHRMTPAEAQRYLDSLELFGMRFGLDRMRRLMTALGSPQSQFDSIHVVGTNGKSSTTRMIAAILRAHGIDSGAYLSPHVLSFAERIEVGGGAVTAERFAAAVGRVAQAVELVERTLVDDDCVTQFEVLTAAAYWELAQARVGVAAIEAGLGGRYDATSVIESNVQVLTNVGLEHTRWLGPTETDIATEKLAVVPEGGTLVTGRLSDQVLKVARAMAADRGASLSVAGQDFEIDAGVELSVLGRFQRENFAVAAAAAEAYMEGIDRAALSAAAGALRLPGRLEPIGAHPLLLLDGAHNPGGVRALVASLPEATGARRPIGVVSILEDKDAAAMLEQLLPACEAVVFTRSEHPRALSPATLDSLARQLGGPTAEIVVDPHAAVERARELAGAEGAVLVTGSIYLLADLADLTSNPVNRGITG